jgi:Tfp pilus assembly protein PilN
VVTQLRLPWGAILHEIETRTGPDVALLNMEAQGPTRTLRLTGEAKTMTDVLAYLSRLRESGLIESANLTHHEEKQVGAVSIIRFSLDATWKALT